jgi:hypothetical protein
MKILNEKLRQDLRTWHLAKKTSISYKTIITDIPMHLNMTIPHITDNPCPATVASDAEQHESQYLCDESGFLGVSDRAC